jgi:hypothetical protein
MNFFKSALRTTTLLVSIYLLLSCSPKDDRPIIFERGNVPSFCVPLMDEQGDKIFEKFKTYILKDEAKLSTDGAVWRIYGPLKCGDTISFFGKKDIQHKNGKVYLEVGAHFNVNYDATRDEFQTFGGM